MTSKNTKRKNVFRAKGTRQSKKWKVRVEKETDPFLARIIIDGEWDGNWKEARKLLEDVCPKLPKGKKVEFLITCAGFIHFEPPDDFSKIGDNKKPNDKAVKLLVKKAEEQCTMILDKRLREELSKHTHFITLGVDGSENKIQLVGLVNLKNNQYHWTGKSFPTSEEERKLILVSNLGTHFVDLDNIGRVMILDCHDLSVFSQRGAATTRKKWRKDIREKLSKMVKKTEPGIVLHLAHTTYSSKTWTDKWNRLCKLATVQKYASAFRYLNGKDGKTRSFLNDVRHKTKLGNTIDFIVNTRG